MKPDLRHAILHWVDLLSSIAFMGLWILAWWPGAKASVGIAIGGGLGLLSLILRALEEFYPRSRRLFRHPRKRLEFAWHKPLLYLGASIAFVAGLLHGVHSKKAQIFFIVLTIFLTLLFLHQSSRLYKTWRLGFEPTEKKPASKPSK